MTKGAKGTPGAEEQAGDGRARGPDAEQDVEPARDARPEDDAALERDQGTETVSVLKHLGTDLIEASSGRPTLAEGDLWAAELTKVKEILERRERHAAVLVGPDGVGKRALVLALAHHIAEGRAPKHLVGRRVIELPFHRVLSSVRQPGDFERIVFTALREAGTRDDVLLFLNQITNFMGILGGRGTPLNAAYAIETACHQPGLFLLGSATPELYREAVAAFPWCLNVMTRVDVSEPSRESTTVLLDGLTDVLAEYHGVRIADEAVGAAVDLSADYIRDRVLPGKAYELLDQAAAKAVTRVPAGETATVGRKDVTEALSELVGIPPDKLATPGHSELLGLEEALKARIKGQDNCIRKLADVIRVTKLGLDSRPSRPNGVFLFVGPPGVGKSELAHALAEELYGEPGWLFEFNMARYSDDDGVARLVGVEVGDVDYAGDLAAAVARSPHSIIVFEHIERSHRDVAVLLMQIFRDGYVVDGHGTTLHFSNATIILTTSADSLVPNLDNNGALGFGLSDRDRDEHHLREAKVAIEAFFPPDFMDGIDEVLIFEPLSQQALKEIVGVRLDDIRGRLALRSIDLHVTDGAVAQLAEKGASREYGARNLGRTVEGTLLKPLAKFLLANPSARQITARAVEGDIEICEGTHRSVAPDQS